MSAVRPHASWSTRVFRWVVPIVLTGAVGVYVGARLGERSAAPPPVDSPVEPPAAAAGPTPGPAAAAAKSSAPHEPIVFPRESWESAGVEMRPVAGGAFASNVELTGKISLNEDHVAHIFPLVDGRVDEVRVQFGQRVKKDDVLVVVQSKEVGATMLELYQERQKRDFVRVKDGWTQQVAKNVHELIEAIKKDVSIDAIEEQFKHRPMGEYREKLLSAYVSLFRSKADFERLEPLSASGVAPAKQLMAAVAERNADRARLQSWIEQIQQESEQAALISRQAVKEAETRVAVAETNLKILGFSDDQLSDVDPIAAGEAVSHYPVTSPFDGTIISKDVVLLERVGPESQILSIADLSTVWVTTDIYEEHLPLLRELGGKTLKVRSPVWPDRSFEAQVFYTGEIVDESSRTIAMRAVAENVDGLLKPGMFVTVELPESQRADALQIPSAAVLEHEGSTFVFVHVEGDRFERRDVRLGGHNESNVEVLEGLRGGEQLVVRGGFALKSRMLAELLSEE